MDSPTPLKDTIRRDHALHNEEVCRHIAERKEFGDWVITTAFYAALHWMHYRIFPFSYVDPETDQSITVHTLDEYRRTVSGHWRFSESKHRMLIDLVQKTCPSQIAAEYRRLFDLCMTARYKNYRTAPPIIGVVQDSLRRIRLYCDEEQEEKNRP